MPPVALRPRSTTEIIDAAVQLLRLHYKELVTASALFLIPVAVLQVLVVGAAPRTPDQIMSVTYWMQLIGLGVAAAVLASMATAAVVVIVSESYIGHKVSIASAVQRVINRIWTLFGASLFQSLFIVLGFLLFIIPGFVFAAWTFAMPIIVLVENRGVGDAFSRSKSLASGSVLRILGTLLLAAIVVWIITAVVGVFLAYLVMTGHYGQISNAVVSAAIRILVSPFLTVVTVLLYYDLRIRKEGYDLEIMARELGLPTATPAAPPAVA